MSGPTAIAAVTATLRAVISTRVTAEVNGSSVVTRPPDRVLAGGAGQLVNVFLYHTSVNAAFRNAETWGNIRRGETAPTPLALVLHYLVTAYGENDDETQSSRLLGSAMFALHEHPVLDPKMIALAFPGTDLTQQVEHVRVTFEPLSIDEMSRLWTTFQTQFRVSATYQASVVVIDSLRGATFPAPVLSRDPDDRGPVATADPTLPFPRLDPVTFPAGETAGKPGADLVLTGRQLAGTALRLHWVHLRTGTAVDVDVPPGSFITERVSTQVPAEPGQVQAGIYALSAVLTAADGSSHTSNDVSVAVMPTITSHPETVRLSPAGSATIDLRCDPPVLPAQDVSLVLGDRPFSAPPRPAPTDQLRFTVTGLGPRSYLLRLRVDAVDSPLIDYSTSPPHFDAQQRVTLE